MSNLLTVQDPDESAVEQATETRRLLQIWADKHLPAVEQEEILPVSTERAQELRKRGAEGLTRAEQHLSGLGELYKPQSEFGELLAKYISAVREVNNLFPRDDNPREFSYALEGCVKEFQKRFFQKGMGWNTHAEWLAVASSQYPASTTGYQDRVMCKALGMYEVYGRASQQYMMQGLYNVQAGAYSPLQGKLLASTLERFRGIVDWLSVQGEARVSGRDAEYWVENLCSFSYPGLIVHYMEADGPWVAGYLTLDDACRLRFRRVRLGAYLAEQGESDATVRSYVEKAKQKVAGAEFTAYPNDTEWEHAYTRGPGSCMADSASEYSTWDDIHPVSTYCSSLHGCGDNSLVLITSTEGGSITGRGILNLQSGSIVRWYGDNQAERVLKRSGVNTDDREALEGSWLAHLSKGERFIHPYVDGDLGYGEIEDGRVYIRNDGICIQETSGSSYSGTAYYCEDTEREMGEDECTYQEVTDTYISDNCDDWRCPLINEWVSRYNRTEIMLHGVYTEVSEYAWYRINHFATNMNGGRSKSATNYSIDDEDDRQRFLDEHGLDDIDEDEEDDESEEAA